METTLHIPVPTWVPAAALIVAAVLTWWLAASRHRQTLARRALSATSANERADTVDRLIGRGLDLHAHSLLWLLRTETDPIVTNRLAAGIARHQWAPDSSDAIVGLRMWAHERLNGANPPSAGRTIHPRRRILVTGAGGPAGIAVIDALRAGSHVVIAVDADPNAVGGHLAHHFTTIPRADDDLFVDALIDVGTRYGADTILATVTEELIVLAGTETRFADAGIAAWFPSRDAVATCADKALFAIALSGAGLDHPRTQVTDPAGVDPSDGPWIVKPRNGRGSRGVTRVERPEDLDAAVRHAGGVGIAVIQDAVDGDEFTMDCLVGPDGVFAGGAARWRTDTRGGISTVGTTFTNQAVTDAAAAATAAVGLVGPACVQGFVRPDGSVVIIEINPRFSGGLPLTLAAGCDIVGETVRVAAGQPVDAARLDAVDGIRMRRWFTAVFDQDNTDR